MRGLGVDTVLGHLGETHQHVLAGDAVLVEAGDYSKEIGKIVLSLSPEQYFSGTPQ